MNYIEYMSGGGSTDSTYVRNIPLKETIGPKSSLTFKRNNWIKAIKDAIVSNKANNAQNPSVVTSDVEPNNDNNIPIINTPSSRAGLYISALGSLAGSGMYRLINNKSRP